jgi:hypothetical protein
MLAGRINKKQGLIPVLLLLVCAATPTLAQGWHGVVPLKSTRADAERILGRPEKRTADVSIYKFRAEKVFVVYSSGPCNTSPEGWDVPRDTVINITITPEPRPTVTGLKLNDRDYKFKRDGEVLDIAYYVNEDAGITYEVDTREGVVKGITYSPTSKQAALRCPGAGERILQTFKFGEYIGVDPKGGDRLLNNFAAVLTKQNSAEAYLVVYEDGSVTDEDAGTHRRTIKEYLINRLHLDARRIQVLDGGCRQKPAVELYVVPPGGYSPTSTPDCECNRTPYDPAHGNAWRGLKPSQSTRADVERLLGEPIRGPVAGIFSEL